jgi:hypothetical protein
MVGALCPPCVQVRDLANEVDAAFAAAELLKAYLRELRREGEQSAKAKAKPAKA